MKTKNELKNDIFFSIVTLLFALFFTISIFVTIEARDETIVGARTFPYFIAAGLFILGTCLFYSSLKQLKLNEFTLEDTLNLSFKQIQAVSLYLLILVLYCLGIMYIGYIVSSALVLLVLMLFYGARNKLIISLMVCIVPFVMWLVFSVLMEVQFPQTLLY
ncbi:tripartite tricarboxylate transporter TctB family protein [Desulfovibrio litoralis]|uniref:Tripartite tricarboxylate transporter TctB family protein n=1 Tax=Desulfovibrio litoralis DSM 11393 TaxID=1121455 RepID=A0A1M7SMU0_9BACT|nr:tripartite tricarboxylate transporter TctB family protein [Desulfovibrio litoralis]SHN59785.1 Tripartite tricarboxylate transporter TctB family protein [Desulfovibrio litoralis DSM 11393]